VAGLSPADWTPRRYAAATQTDKGSAGGEGYDSAAFCSTFLCNEVGRGRTWQRAVGHARGTPGRWSPHRYLIIGARSRVRDDAIAGAAGDPRHATVATAERYTHVGSLESAVALRAHPLSGTQRAGAAAVRQAVIFPLSPVGRPASPFELHKPARSADSWAMTKSICFPEPGVDRPLLVTEPSFVVRLAACSGICPA
jgi:hypothetical protein